MRLLATVRGSPNIAFVKYWGKRDVQRNLPLNGSISLTLSSEDLYTQTTVILDDSFENNEFCINNDHPTRIQSFEKHKKILSMIQFFRQQTNGYFDQNDQLVSKEQLKNCPIHISTTNSFPTASGLASSASGFACLASCLSVVYQVYNKETERDLLNAIVRQGSGSACRSMYGGFVEWYRGTEDLGGDSIARQLYPSSHWPDLRVIIIINEDKTKEKLVKSTQGMQCTAATSELFNYRIQHCVTDHLNHVRDAIQNRDAEQLFQYTIKESNQFHATCMDSNPSIIYLNARSIQFIQLINTLNQYYHHPIVGYSYDAGANTFLFTTIQYYNDLLYLLSNINILSHTTLPLNESSVSSTIRSFCDQYSSFLPESVYDILCTKGGDGPQVMDLQYHP